jgi:hypothetical protein
MSDIEIERQRPARILADSAIETTYSDMTSDAGTKDAISQQITAQNIVKEKEEAQYIVEEKEEAPYIVEEKEEGTIGIQMEEHPADRMLTVSSSTPLQPLQAMEVHHDNSEIEMERQRPVRILADSATETTYSDMTSDAGTKDAISQQITAQNIVEENEEARNIVEENEDGIIGIQMDLQATEVYHASSVVEEKEGPCTAACRYDSWKTRGPLFDPKRLSCREGPSDEVDEVIVEAIPVPASTPVDPFVHAESNVLSRDAEGNIKSMKEKIADSLGKIAHRRRGEEETFTEPSKEKSRKRGRKSSSFLDKIKLLSVLNCGSGSYGLQDI